MSYKSQLKAYIDFCSTHNIQPVPATPTNICRYIAFLYRNKAFSTIQQYICVIRLLHLEMGLPHPYQNNHQVSSLLKAVKRAKGYSPAYKLSMTLSQVNSIKSHLDVTCLPDAQIWCLIMMCFYGLLRISSATVPSKSSWDVSKTLTRGDISFSGEGTTLTLRHTKTIQFHERTFLPRIPDSPFCPTTALLSFMCQAGNLPPSAPALSYQRLDGRWIVLTPPDARVRLKKLFAAIGLPTTEYNSHSLRRSGATHLLAAGMPLEMIKIMGDWKSDCVFKYLTPNPSSKIQLLNQFI